jgi:transcriptional regulator with XRE-family HTH domain
MSFADNLRAAMERKGISQSELARLLGIKSQAVNQWLKPGGTTPRGTRLHDIAKALGVALQELLGISPAPANKQSRLLVAFDTMDEERREALLTIAELLARLPHMEEQPAASTRHKRTRTAAPSGTRWKRKSGR